MQRFIFLINIIFGLIFTTHGFASQIVDAPHAKVQLISEQISVVADSNVLLGVDFQLEPNWHIYWLNPGDSGAPPRIEWKNPENLKASPLKFPYPHRIDYGGLTSYGHDGRVLLLSEVKVPAELSTGDEFAVAAHLGFLICEKICVPAEVDLTLRLPVVDADPQIDLRWRDDFNKAKEKLPLEQHDLEFQSFATETFFKIIIPDIDNLKDVEFFSTDEDVIQYMEPQQFTKVGSHYELMIMKSEFLTEDIQMLNGALISSTGWGKYKQKALTIAVPVESEQTFAELGGVDTKKSIGVLAAIVFAFIGGLILNLMPCVLPVLSLKVIGLIKHAEDESNAWKHGWVFSFGVIVSFWILAAVLMILRTAGEHVGWGFQFQSPGFVIFMVWFLFLLALNLFGVFEIGESLTRLNWVKHHGLSASFLSGMLVTIVATPCTAPFMGAAIGFALTQTVIVAFTVFFALGFGLAFPYLVLTCNPRFLKFVPKPGAWMLQFKAFMGLLMLISVLWFLWILDAQLGRSALRVMFVSLLISAVGAWFLFHAQRKSRKQKFKPIAFLILIAGLVVGFQAIPFKTETIKNTASKINWIEYSADIVDEYRQQGRAVFIDFTARWCLTCQVNERVALEDDNVQRLISEKQIVMIKADWTNYDQAITEALESFGKNSIPFYVLYLPADSNPVILPEVITPAIVIEKFNQIQQK